MRKVRHKHYFRKRGGPSAKLLKVIGGGYMWCRCGAVRITGIAFVNDALLDAVLKP